MLEHVSLNARKVLTHLSKLWSARSLTQRRTIAVTSLYYDCCDGCGPRYRDRANHSRCRYHSHVSRCRHSKGSDANCAVRFRRGVDSLSDRDRFFRVRVALTSLPVRTFHRFQLISSMLSRIICHCRSQPCDDGDAVDCATAYFSDSDCIACPGGRPRIYGCRRSSLWLSSLWYDSVRTLSMGSSPVATWPAGHR